MTGANMNFMQPVTASYTGHDSDAGFVPSSLKLQHKELLKENFFSYSMKRDHGSTGSRRKM